MCKACVQFQVDPSLLIERPEIGEVYVARYTTSSNEAQGWYRVTVLETDVRRREALVFFNDYGYSAWLRFYAIHRLHTDSLYLHALPMQVSTGAAIHRLHTDSESLALSTRPTNTMIKLHERLIMGGRKLLSTEF